ncbi:MAG: SufE family protein [Shewanella xiamenensis]|jgi:cysteine desulfuration protein SufE|uniref:SufE family protein n=1 Tax=Shewanella TaxID=22 RepID=UPI000B516EC4|nr:MULTISPECIES: SufE family protein [Shewanella]ASF17155.1 SufE family protein [Shewanella sp. FDAARGOS_354]MCD8549986.1 SufE family protein [Shewanella xiamenensis]MCD8560137.1 SufE family protein [Shewanella xiamenensis]MDH1627637.1 SufE family protein [Shewanella xiamenensis]MDV5245993.1 SufE family protein [Shewanella xiamenensis]
MTLPIMPPATDFAYQVEDAATLLARFEQAPNWQERYRQIMLLGKTLPTLADAFRLESVQVKGCESNAWLYHIEQDGKHYFLADSDARIVKGLIGLLLSACHGKQSYEILAFDPSAYFKQLGLEGQLSPSRTNGLHALAKAMIDAVKP